MDDDETIPFLDPGNVFMDTTMTIGFIEPPALHTENSWTSAKKEPELVR